jgi:hypothetical protein
MPFSPLVPRVLAFFCGAVVGFIPASNAGKIQSAVIAALCGTNALAALVICEKQDQLMVLEEIKEIISKIQNLIILKEKFQKNEMGSPDLFLEINKAIEFECGRMIKCLGLANDNLSDDLTFSNQEIQQVYDEIKYSEEGEEI